MYTSHPVIYFLRSASCDVGLPETRTVLEGALARLLDGMSGMAVKGPVAALAELMAVRSGSARLHHAVVVGGEGVGGKIVHDDASFGF